MANDNGTDDDGMPEMPERLGFLGNWRWRQPAAGEDGETWSCRTAAQRDRLVLETAGWLGVGRRVRVHSDRRVGGEFAGRKGTVARLCGAVFADYVMVEFEPVGWQTVTRTRMFPIEVLEPVGDEP